MIRFVGAGPVLAFAAACMLTIAGPGQASAQQVSPTSPAPPITLAKPAVATATVVPATISTAISTSVSISTAKPAIPTATSIPVTNSTGTAIPAPKRAIPTAEATLQALFGRASPNRPSATGTADLYSLVEANRNGDTLDAEVSCLATAVYFEARGESLEGQLAVAEVVMNRAGSGRYPSSWCAVVKQPAQFSFVRSGGRFPAINPGCQHWAKAQAIARIATKRLASNLPSDVLWYHADYVAPSWGRRLSRVSQIGAHIFYRS
jgi:spore germination cell wall hydrolase CwlJ-like protein